MDRTLIAEMSVKRRSPSAESRRLQTLIGVAADVQHGLAGRPFEWGGGEGKSKRQALAHLGLQLVTRTRAEKLGHQLVARTRPVGSIYFEAPISRHCDVYVLGVQTRPSQSQNQQKSSPSDG